MGAMVAVILCAACGADTTGPTQGGPTYLRVINSVFQTGASTVPVAIDLLVDSASSSPSVFGIVPAGTSSGDGAGGYATLGSGVHSFVARRAGDTSITASLYTTTADLPYLPKQSLFGHGYYSVVVAGVIPEIGTITNNTVPFVVILDDHFPGPTVNHVVQARFNVINAAPYAAASGNGATVSVYVNPEDTFSGNIADYPPLTTARYRNVSGYINLDPGAYVVTIRAGTTTLAQQTIMFAAGEVRSLILQSTAAAAPSMANHALMNILD